MAGFEVSGRRFRTESDYRAALRDQTKIEKIRAQVNMEQPGEVITLYGDMQSGKYRFETVVGNDFDDEIYELAQRFREQGYTRDSRLPAADDKNDRSITGRRKMRRNKRDGRTGVHGRNMERVERKGSSDRSHDGRRRDDEIDEKMKQEILHELKKRERHRKLAIFLCSVGAFLCFGYFGIYYYSAGRMQTSYENLAQLKENVGTRTGTLFHQIHYTEEDEVELEVLEEYQTLYNKNKKLIGWLKIDDTNIDYPVMQTVNNEYYLDHNFDQEYDKSGSLFLDRDCDVVHRNTNLIIYGHHMKSGKMFGSLDKYSSEEYARKHPIIQFDTIYEKGTYEVMYVFRSRIYNEDEIVFKYYQFLDAASEKEFDSNMQEMEALSLYATGVKASYGDELLTLSTCDHSETDGRFVVVARRVKEEN